MIFLMLMFTGLTVFAQNSPSDKLFNSLSEKEGVTILSFSKSMLDFVDMDFDDSEITGDLNRIKILIYSTSDVKQPLNLRRQAGKYLSGRYKKVEPSDIDNDAGPDDDEDVDIMVLRNGNRVKECHVIVADGDDADGGGVIISFFGNFKVEDLKKLASKAEKYN